MDVRHEEIMAMAEAFLGPDFDHDKLDQIERQQRALQASQAELAHALASRRIGRSEYLAEVTQVHRAIAKRCEAILGARDFVKLFGVPASEIGPCIDEEMFMAQPVEMIQPPLASP